MIQKSINRIKLTGKFPFLRQKYKDVIISAIAGAMGIYLQWDIASVIIFVIFIWSLINPVSGRYFLAIALFFLIFSPFFLMMKRDDLAEGFAIYAYYFLVMAVVMGIYEMWKEGGEEGA